MVSPDRSDDALLQLPRRSRGSWSERQRRGGALKIARFLPARRAPSQVPLDRVDVVKVGNAERMLGEPIANGGAIHDGSLSSFDLRILMRADRSRVFTVPSGIASASAISRAVIPRK